MNQGIAVTTGTGKYEELLEKCERLDAVATAVVHPCEGAALSGAVEAADKGLIIPILVGPRAKIEATADVLGVDVRHLQIVDAPHSHASAGKTVRMMGAGRGGA